MHRHMDKDNERWISECIKLLPCIIILIHQVATVAVETLTYAAIVTFTSSKYDKLQATWMYKQISRRTDLTRFNLIQLICSSIQDVPPYLLHLHRYYSS